MAALYDWLNDQIRNVKVIGSRLNDEFNRIAWNNTTLSKTGTYTVTNADKGKTIALGGNTLYTLTFDRAGQVYDANFAVKVVNKDTWASGRGKRIVSADGDFADPAITMLWPKQTVTIAMSGGTLGRDPHFQRARLPSGTNTFNLLFGTGSDTLGDGMGNDAGAWNTIQGGFYNVSNYFDFSASPQSIVDLQMRTNETGGTGAHMSTHALAPGAQGGAAITLSGNGALYTTTNQNLQLYHGTILSINNIVLETTGADGNIGVNRGAYLYLGAGVIFAGNSGAGADMTVTDGGIIELDNDYIISGVNKRTYHIINSGGTIKNATAINVTLIASQVVTYWVVSQDPGSTNLGQVTWINPGIVTGTKWFVSANHVLYQTATFPGTIAGSTTTGGQAI